MDEFSASPPHKADNPADSPAAGGAPEAPPAVARSIGERLRAGREKAGLSIAAAGEKLHLDPKIIEALEADRYAEVGASVYVRGHLRRYADFVGEPGGELVAMYVARETRATTPDLRQVPQAERRADPRRLQKPLVLLASFGVILAAVWWVLAGSGANRTASTPEPQTLEPATPEPETPESMEFGDELPVSAALATPASLSSSTVVEAAVPVSAAVASSPPARAVTEEVAVAKPAEPPARDIRLRLELTNDSWVEVHDARGDRLFYDVATAGSVQTVSGRGPLRVVLGNAAGVRVQVDGEPRQIPANAVVGEEARFVVNRTGSLSRARQ